jgi:cellulose synthase/poly-beta-1,6-N-acetylglucosamine synthase-like glycosyltransferase
MLISTVTMINWFILCYLIVLSTGYLILMLTALPDILLRYRESEVLDLSSLIHFNIMPHMTIIVPAYNEENNILETIYSILRSDYTNIDIIVVSPGSTDKTLEKLITEFDLIPVHPLMEEVIKTYGKIKNYYVSRFL